MSAARGLIRADEVLSRFFRGQCRSVTARRAERLRAVERDLRGCIDACAPGMFGAQECTLLALERQFEPAGAVTRVAGADVVLLLLPLFLDDPRWHGDEFEDRRLRIRIAEPLAEAIVHDVGDAPVGVDLGRAALVVGAAVRHEVWLLRQEREALRRR